MNDQYTPPYTGTREQLEPQKDKAFQWFLDHCEKLIAKFDDEGVRELAMERLNEARNDQSLRFDFQIEIVQTKGPYTSSTSKSFNFKAGLGRGGWSNQSFTMRKNGTLNDILLTDALYKKYARALAERRRNSRRTANREHIEALGIEIPSGFTVTASDTELGVATVDIRVGHLVVSKVKVVIAELPTFIPHLEQEVSSLSGVIEAAASRVRETSE